MLWWLGPIILSLRIGSARSSCRCGFARPAHHVA